MAQLTTWNQGAGLHPGAPMRCGSAGVSLGARSLYEQNGRSFRLCTADNRGRRLSPKTFSPKELISCLAGVCASPGPGAPVWPAPWTARHSRARGTFWT